MNKSRNEKIARIDFFEKFPNKKAWFLNEEDKLWIKRREKEFDGDGEK